MLFRLSLDWGVPISILQEQLSAQELGDYQAYYSIEPWGGVAADIRTAIIAHTTASCFSKSAPEFKSFLPQWEPQKVMDYSEGSRAFTELFGSI